MLTDKQKNKAIKFVENLHGEYNSEESNDRVKEMLDQTQEFKKKLFKFLQKSEKKHNILVIYTGLKAITDLIEEEMPAFKNVRKEAKQIEKLYKEHLEECKEEEDV